MISKTFNTENMPDRPIQIQIHQNQKKSISKNIFISQNRFTPLLNTTDITPMDTSTQTKALPNTLETPELPPIFIQTQVNYCNFYQKMLELTRNSGFECKSSMNTVKLPTHNADLYRSISKNKKSLFILTSPKNRNRFH